jgi:hypothetical protein
MVTNCINIAVLSRYFLLVVCVIQTGGNKMLASAFFKCSIFFPFVIPRDEMD